MRFDGDIIITDPCYIFGEKNWIDIYNHYKEKLPKYMAPNENKIGFYKEEIATFEAFIKTPMGQKQQEGYDSLIEKYQKRIEQLNKEENFVAHDDLRYPVYNCLDYLGFSVDIFGDTLCGDWSASVFNTDTGEKMGDFCADAALYCVLLLDEAMKYNAEKVKELLQRKWCVARINDFHGDISVELKDKEYEYDGEKRMDTIVEIVGTGNINFIARQTGF